MQTFWGFVVFKHRKRCEKPLFCCIVMEGMGDHYFFHYLIHFFGFSHLTTFHGYFLHHTLISFEATLTSHCHAAVNRESSETCHGAQGSTGIWYLRFCSWKALLARFFSFFSLWNQTWRTNNEQTWLLLEASCKFRKFTLELCSLVS